MASNFEKIFGKSSDDYNKKMSKERGKDMSKLSSHIADAIVNPIKYKKAQMKTMNMGLFGPKKSK